MKPDCKLTNKSGIYQIRNIINGKVYIGRTKCFYKRCHQYVYDFKTRKIGHLNTYLTRSIEKHGLENFNFEVLEFCVNEVTPERELHWILLKNSNQRDIGYNLRLDVKGRMITDPETSIKISNRLKLEWENGLRSGHSKKLKESWKCRDRKKQSQLLTKTLTKYDYLVSFPHSNPLVCSYDTLKLFKLSNVLSTFSKRKINETFHKGCFIQRRLIHGEN